MTRWMHAAAFKQHWSCLCCTFSLGFYNFIQQAGSAYSHPEVWWAIFSNVTCILPLHTRCPWCTGRGNNGHGELKVPFLEGDKVYIKRVEEAWWDRSQVYQPGDSSAGFFFIFTHFFSFSFTHWLGLILKTSWLVVSTKTFFLRLRESSLLGLNYSSSQQ